MKNQYVTQWNLSKAENYGSKIIMPLFVSAIFFH